MESLLQKIEKNWESCRLNLHSKKGKNRRETRTPLKVIVCVSGGSDSVALLHLLHRLSKLLCLKLHVLFFNHRLRPEANEERDFVESLAKKYEIPFYCKTSKYLHRGQSGLQEKARKWRILESRNILDSLGGGCIATGHHADDQTETILLKLLRGAHISNLKGMCWSKPPFVRPLLNCSKSELRDFLEINNYIWMEDSSNQSIDYLRNRVRIELIPLLEKLTRNGLQSRIVDLSEQSKVIRDWLNHGYNEWVKNPGKASGKNNGIIFLSDLENTSILVQHEIMHNFVFFRTGQALSYRKLQKIFFLIQGKNKFWELHLSKNWKICFSQGEISLKTR